LHFAPEDLAFFMVTLICGTTLFSVDKKIQFNSKFYDMKFLRAGKSVKSVD
jgi:hypothetical protein